MKQIFARFLYAMLGLASHGSAQDLRPPVNSQALQDAITQDALLAEANRLYSFATAHRGITRVMGSPGHIDTINYYLDTLRALGSYDVTVQEYEWRGPLDNVTSLVINGDAQAADLMHFSSMAPPRGGTSGTLVTVDNLGCNAIDFPAQASKNIVLISRGNCTCTTKVLNAMNAGAVGAVIYNNITGPFLEWLYPNKMGGYVPTFRIEQAAGQALLASLRAGMVMNANLTQEILTRNRTTYNVIAETKDGDHDSVVVLGAHTDSAAEGPGINDDGSGIIGILEVAKALSRYSVTNAVRFGFWTGEEKGLLGSRHYVDSLSAEELGKVRLYLNFDMIASPNYVSSICDGDGSLSNDTFPAGSAEIEAQFQNFYVANGQNFTDSPLRDPKYDSFRSDYAPFIEAGIATGGLSTGADEIKTEAEAAAFGGTAGLAHDPNYHRPSDNVENLNLDAFLLNTRAIANAVALYATSLDSIPVRAASVNQKSSNGSDSKAAVQKA